MTEYHINGRCETAQTSLQLDPTYSIPTRTFNKKTVNAVPPTTRVTRSGSALLQKRPNQQKIKYQHVS